MTDETKDPKPVRPAKKAAGKTDVDALLTEIAPAAKAPKAEKAVKAAKPAAVEAAPAPKAAEAKPAAPKVAEAAKTVRIRQIRSGICAPVDQKLTLKGLGLKRIRHEVVRTDSPTLRGQILKVRHLVEVVAD